MLIKQSLSAFVNALPDCCGYSYWPPKTFNYYIAAGWREDDFNWTVKNSRKSKRWPEVISRVKWKNLGMYQLSGGFRYICRKYVARFHGDIGWVYNGRNKDLDFLETFGSSSSSSSNSSSSDGSSSSSSGSGRKIIISKSSNKSDHGYAYDLVPGVGYQLTSNGGRCIVTPMAGGSYRGQKLHIEKGKQKINLFNPQHIGHIKDLHSTYITRWWGGWVGAEFETKVECNAWLFGGFQWHWLRYRAKGHWNLRKDMESFRHQANAQGYVADLGFSWECIPNFTVGFRGDYKFFHTDTGKEISRFKVFDQPLGKSRHIRVKGTLRRAHWHIISVSAFLGYRF
jgi:hypothetical protein